MVVVGIGWTCTINNTPRNVDLLSLLLFLTPFYRKRRKGLLKVEADVLDGGGDSTGTHEAQPPQQAAVKPAEGRKEDEARLQKKSDDLWASFLSDVGSRPKGSTSASESSTSPKVNVFEDIMSAYDATITDLSDRHLSFYISTGWFVSVECFSSEDCRRTFQGHYHKSFWLRWRRS